MNKGIIASIFSYVIWGFFPIYFHALSSVPAEQTTSHRVVWSFLFIMLVILIRKEFKSFHCVPYLEEDRYLLHGRRTAGD